MKAVQVDSTNEPIEKVVGEGDRFEACILMYADAVDWSSKITFKNRWLNRSINDGKAWTGWIGPAGELFGLGERAETYWRSLCDLIKLAESGAFEEKVKGVESGG